MRPNFVKVGAHRYEVVFSSEDLALIAARDKSELLGYSNHWNLIITIHSNLSHTIERESLLHEVIHCIWTVSGMGAVKDLVSEEVMVRGVEHVFFQVLTNNPIFLKYLADKEK